MAESVRVCAEKIKRLEIQGARNVAIAAIQALEVLAEQTKSKTREDFIAELIEAKEMLFSSRETEPLMRNALRWITCHVEDSDERRVQELARVVSVSAQEFQKSLQKSKERIAEIGAKRIRDGGTVLTHCRSSTVTYMLKKAKSQGKNFEVIATETRPAFQGRVTANEMLSLGVKTTFIVDSAARSFIKNADLVLVGADALTSEGNVVNKIGTGTLALVASEARIPFYVVTELLKFDPATMFGDYEKIENRSRDEIWKEAPIELNIQNPAFDVTRRDYISGVICEEGIVSPHSITEIVHRVYPWMFL